MILTQCAVCATDLGLSLGKKCGRCSTRYCGPECQKQHWEGGGHDKLCKKIKRAGGAEQHYADTKYSEAVTVAAEACADDTKGQTCFICTQALHWKTKEGLVRGCSCRGTAGFVHVSCLAEQAKILVAEAEENNLDRQAIASRLDRWRLCGLCKQEFHGVVFCALGWACWKTYCGRSENDWIRGASMTALGTGLYMTHSYADALTAFEGDLAMMQRIRAPEFMMQSQKTNVANCYDYLGRKDEALVIRREIYAWRRINLGFSNDLTQTAALNVSHSLIESGRIPEAKSICYEVIGALPPNALTSFNMLRLRQKLAWAEFDDGNLREAQAMYEDLERSTLRVLGPAHPLTQGVQSYLKETRSRRAAATLPAFGQNSDSDAPGPGEDRPRRE